MLTLSTNRQDYQNDIAETIRAFLNITNIELGNWESSQGYAVEALIDSEKSCAVARGRKSNKAAIAIPANITSSIF